MLTAITLCGIDNPNGTKLKLFINGRFLSQKLTGVQRYAAWSKRLMPCLHPTIARCPQGSRVAIARTE
ncbi:MULTISPECIES: hypothetical protein [unclassified Bradyrhizobium]|uniref:hypothetical protein n=1 Tax=unclassified Bradyrhizobium TaxID=2631580 RepID=UPI001FF83DEE|nr:MULTISPECIES: hypothetical protein [unclassified Bradyrhizobium]